MEALRPASASAVRYRATVCGVAGSESSPCLSHHAAKWFQSERYAFTVFEAFACPMYSFARLATSTQVCKLTLILRH